MNGRVIDELILFLHIPRTGGTTLRDILDRQYQLSKTVDVERFVDAKSEIGRIPSERINDLSLIKGHLPFGTHEWIARPCKYFTFLRDPVGRVISTYKYARGHPDHKDYKLVQSISLMEYLKYGRNVMLDNGMTRLLAGHQHMFEIPYRQVRNVHFDIAKMNLTTYFTVVGITSRFDESILALSYELGWKAPYYSRANRTRADINLDNSTLHTIEEYNQFDLELFKLGNDLLDAKIRSILDFKRLLHQFEWRNRVLGRFFIRNRLDRFLENLLRKVSTYC